jgi:hypothetical protein
MSPGNTKKTQYSDGNSVSGREVIRSMAVSSSAWCRRMVPESTAPLVGCLVRQKKKIITCCICRHL